jgi:hypothetical protein
MAALAVAVVLAPPVVAQQRPAPQPELRRVVRPAATSQTVAPAVIEPPAGVVAQVPADAVVLRPGNSATTLQSLRVARQYALPALRTQPVINVQAGRVDLKPMLANPKALFNVAQQLRAQPQLVQVTADETQVLEVEQGLVVRSFLGYRLRTGACSDRGRASQLANTGARCFTQMTPQTRAAAFANPRDPHFVADPRQRAMALRKAEDQAVQVRAQVSSDIASLRTMLADPAQRATIEAEIGAAETARLASLDDARLEAEVVNAGETRIEQVMFVPARGRLNASRFHKAGEFAGAQATAAAKDAPPTFLKMTVQEQPALMQIAVIPPQQVDRPLEQRVFLTGFTLGNAYEWRQRVETTIKWCLVGCKKTYYVELYAGFDYGFGLRFPMAVGGTYRYRQQAGVETASLVADFRSIDGSAGDYADTGLPGSKLFDGKELVAQFGAYAGAGYHVPIFGSGNARFDTGMDFTEGLPAPLTNGQFRPPMPGESLPVEPKIFDNVDLIGGRANFGVVGGQVFPALKAELHSDAMRLTLRDNIAGKDVQITSNGQVVPLAVDAKHTSDFSIGNPVYNLGFLLTPGIDARLFIDIEVWSDHWDWPVWFPQLAVQLPPGGVDFACHADTMCSRNYRMSPGGSIEMDTAVANFLRDMEPKLNAFESEYLTQCADDICKTGIKLLRTNAYLVGKQAIEANKTAQVSVLDPTLASAEETAKKLVHESQMRLTQKAGKGWAILAQEVWSKRCSDMLCLNKVSTLADQMVVAANVLQLAKPEASSLAVQGEINREYGARFQAEIDASKARAALTAIKQQPLQFHTMPKPR